jgi:hypothetical protein
MLNELKPSWGVFEKAPAGKRFEALYEARKKSGGTSRLVFTVIGVLLLVGGVVLLFIPGPGLLLIAFGGALIAQQSLWLAKVLDRLELLLRKLARKFQSFWKRASTPIRSAVVAGATICAAGVGYLAYLWLFKR